MEQVMYIIKKAAQRARKHWLTLAFILGFIVDNITLNRVDQLFDNIILLSYVILAMVSIVLLYAAIAERFSDKVNEFFKKWAPVLMQYSFGGLLSGMLIFYGRSGTVTESWPFFLMILGVIYGNETITNRQGRLVYNLVIFFVGLFAYIVLVVPVVLGKMGAWVFVGSGFFALFIMYWFFRALEKIVPRFIELQKRNVVFIIGIIYVTLNVLYFTNVIPPIPLSMKHVGIYHSVERIGGEEYQLTYEKPSWWVWYRNSDSTFHYRKDEPVYCYASVFAPSRLATDIYHLWEYYDDEQKRWVEHARIAYTIEGGRGEGYRGYTRIEGYHEGKWKCTVETARGQVIGSEKFKISSGVRGELVTRIE